MHSRLLISQHDDCDCDSADDVSGGDKNDGLSNNEMFEINEYYSKDCDTNGSNTCRNCNRHQ